PKFVDLLKMLKDSKEPSAKHIRLNVETKIYPSKPELTPIPDKFVELILEQLRAYNVVSRTTIESFDDRTLISIKEIEPKITTALLTSDNHIDYVSALAKAKADILSPDYEWILPEDVKAVHKAGKKVLPWTVNDPAAWDKMIKMDVDGIITDDPAALV